MVKNKPKIVFRADAGPKIGYGHFMRSLALADMLKDDFENLFYTQCPDKYQYDCAVEIASLQPLPDDESKFGLFLQALSGNEIVVLDNYFFTTEYQQAIKAKGCRLVCIDDLHDRHYVADVVINHGIVDRRSFSVESYTKLCLGFEWALLRKPFLEAVEADIPARDPLKKERSVLVCMGGSDPCNLTYKVLKNLMARKDIAFPIRVVAGKQTVLEDLNPERIEIFRQQTAEQMRDLYLKSDVGVLPTSTVCMEAITCGLPLVVGYYVDNQYDFYAYLYANGYANGLGNLIGEWNPEEPIVFPRSQRFDRSCMKGIPERYRKVFLNLL